VSRTPRRLTRRIALAAVTVLGAVTLAACAGPDEQGSASQRMKAWSSSTEFGGSIATLRADSARIAQVVADRSGTGAIHADCALLLQDAGAANDNLPTPDTTVTNQLSNAYADEGSAANDCYNAGTTNAKLLARSARERAQADALLAQALERVQSITGTTISTTTTTDPGSGSIFG
jgi:hypothetical protein